MTSRLDSRDVLASGGVLARRLEGFRERPQQLAMAEQVGETIARGGQLLIEAPTGVGKSLAYLVPAILEQVSRGRRVVVATHTIALQEQLLEKDLPLLGASLPVEFLAVKAIGRGNYLGRRRLSVALAHAPTLIADDEHVRRLRAIERWSGETDEGTLQDLGQHAGALWELVRSEGDNCLGRRCGTFKTCFYQQARRRLDNAQLIVTNHALYFTDLALKAQNLGLLPPHETLILDEAHHAERVASERFGLELSRRGLLRYLVRLSSGASRQGTLHGLAGPLAGEAVSLVGALKADAGAFFNCVQAWVDEHPSAHGRVREARFVPDTLSENLLTLSRVLEDHMPACRDESEEADVAAASGRALLLGEATRRLLAVDDPDLVYFVDGSQSARDMALVARPLDVGPHLQRHLYGEVGSIIMTSATLASGPGERGMRYTADRLGCPEAQTSMLDTPFDFASRVEFVVPRGVPLPDEPGFGAALSETVLRYVLASRGGAFVLFTSYQSLDATFRDLQGPLARAGLLLLKQGGSLDRSTLLARFREDGHAVLLGADSFWEGVDVPGPALRLVVITRLPFPVPTLPMNAARSENLKARGRSAFGDFFLPEAVIRFRQGFGRLVRTEEDGGRVVCMDRRIAARGYGAKFRKALPPVTWLEQDPPPLPEEKA